jgi:protein-L-isoaspartate(D-aspartate) O-methyltransferase
MSWQQSAREQMIQQQVRAWDVLDPEVLSVLAQVPRERFVPESQAALAFADVALPLPEGQHMLTPKLVGRILQALSLSSRDRVLEVGTGSGFMTACLARMAGPVRSLEIRPLLAERARRALAGLRTGPLEVVTADAFAPDSLRGDWDIIVLTGSLPRYDTRFERLLAPGGRLFAVVGTAPLMTARLITRSGETLVAEDLFETGIDPLTHAPGTDKFRF